MTSIEHISHVQQWNYWGGAFVSFAKSMLLQSSVLIAVLALIDRIVRKRLRAVTLYALWMLLLAKLMLPVSFSLPTGVLRWPDLAPITSATPVRRSRLISPIRNAPFATCLETHVR